MTFSEARQDAERLKKITKREIDVATVTCDCDYAKDCGRCSGEGLYYELRFAFCNHIVQDGDDLECEENDCAHREYKAFCEREEELEAINQ